MGVVTSASRLSELEALRGFAALHVFLHHARPLDGSRFGAIFFIRARSSNTLLSSVWLRDLLLDSRARRPARCGCI
jgi:peptidoglycan/LPS O-acetylase OafA/YrhL